LLVDFKPEDREQTHSVANPDFPFGFEYISKCSFREINLGEPSQVGEKVKIAGREFNTKGFKICGGCGKVLKRNESKEHSISCRYRDKPDTAKIEDVLYLYREFTSEALRFLLPDETFWTAKGQSSFIAALQLGLKLKFGGRIDHLKVTISEEPQPNSSQRKSFLYLYDSVPGGTGYLKQLRTPEELNSLFLKALRHVKLCDCEDGCYRCLFAYRHSFDLDETSRKTAIEQLLAIQKHRHQLKETTQGLSAIRVNSNFESELERRFIEAIRRYQLVSATTDRSPEFPLLKQDIINGRVGYYLKIGEESWTIEMQVSLGKNDGVEVPARADFVFRPASSRSIAKPIVIFTDGWEYHRDRLDLDLQQRLAIVRSNKYWCWSITWDDVEAQLNENYRRKSTSTDGLNCLLNPQFKDRGEHFYQTYECADLRPLESKSSFDWLMSYLAQPDASRWKRWALMRTMAQASRGDNLAVLQQQINSYLSDRGIELWLDHPQYLPTEISISPGLKVLTAVDLQRHRQLNPCASLVALVFVNDSDNLEGEIAIADWIEMLRLSNLYQFLPHFYWLTTQMHQSGISPTLASEIIQTESTSTAQQWTEIQNLMVAEELIEAIGQMQTENWPLPEAGYELCDDRQLVIAMAELAWLDPKIAIVLTPEDGETFNHCGWLAYTTQDLNDQTLADINSKLSGLGD
jgi:DEAD/DEAH box helicase domain-containing protein